MASFFGREVDFSGTELLVKVGTRFNDPNSNPEGHQFSWRDGQIIKAMPLGYHKATMLGYCLLLIKLPNVSYSRIGGRRQETWKIQPGAPTLWDKLNHTTNADGKYKWELISGTEFKRKRQTSDFFVDVEKLFLESLITESLKENIYNHDIQTIITLPSVLSIDDILLHEENDARRKPENLLRHASITSGVHSIGAGLDYDDIASFEAAIGSQLTGDLTGEHANEETAFSSDVTFDTDTNGFLLKLTAAAGAEHNGSAGNGARANFATFGDLHFDETTNGHLADVEVSKIVFDITGQANVGLNIADASVSGLVLVNRCIFAGDSVTRSGIRIPAAAPNVEIRNNIIYGMQDSGQGIGIYYYSLDGSIKIFNNTIAKARIGIHNDSGSSHSGQEIRNNLIQGCTDFDYVTDGSWTSNTSFNISEDASSPDASYQSTDVHTNSVFLDYANDDYRLDPDGDVTNLAIVDDGADLSTEFTEDIIGTSRSDWYIGAYEIVSAAGNLSGTATGTSTADGALKGKGSLSGQADGAAVASANIKATGSLSGQSAGTSVATGRLTGKGSLAGQAAGVGATAGNLVGRGKLSGQVAGTALAEGALQAKGALSGQAAGTSTAQGALSGKGALSGTAAGTSNATGDLTAQSGGNLSGSAAGASTASGILRARGSLSGSAAGASGHSARLSGKGVLSGSVQGAGTAQGAVSGRGRLSGQAAGASTAQGAGKLIGRMHAQAVGQSIVTGVLVGIGRLSGTAAGTSTAAINNVSQVPESVTLHCPITKEITLESTIATEVTVETPFLEE